MSHSAMSMADMAAALIRPPGKKSTREQQLPDVLGIERIQANDVALHVFDRANAGLLLPSNAKLADAVQAIVRLDLDEEVVARSVADGKGFDVVIFIFGSFDGSIISGRD